MPSIIGYIEEETEESVEELVEQGKYEGKSELVNKAVKYYLYNKHGME